MDLAQVLKELHAERQWLIELIANMETLQDGRAPSKWNKRRGRKSMGPEEREQVRERMRPY